MLFEKILKISESSKENSLYKMAAKRTPMTKIEKEERDLIERFQKFSDPIAMQQLTIRFRGTISKAIKDSGLAKIVGLETANQVALGKFRHIVKNKFDLNQMTSKPSTYIYNSLYGALQNEKNDNKSNAARMSQSLERFKTVTGIAQNFLEREGIKNPTDKQIYDYVKKNEMTKGKEFDLNLIKRIRDRSVSEWSGSKRFGGSAAGDAEILTYDEQFGHGKYTPRDLMRNQFEEQKISDEINKFTQKANERRFFREMYSLGEYTGQKSNLNRASINNGVTNHNGKKLLAAFVKKLKEKGVF